MKVSSQLIVVFLFSTADYSFGLLVLINRACTKQKILRKALAAAYETSGRIDTVSQ